MVSLRFGRYGRESGSLLMVTQGGALDIKILRRTVTFERKELNYNGIDRVFKHRVYQNLCFYHRGKQETS